MRGKSAHWLAALILSAMPAVSTAHPAGFHERLALSVSRQAVDGLLVMDIDAGVTAKNIRAGADFDHDGVISPAERKALEKKLVGLATQGLKLGISGYPLTPKVTGVKMSMRDDPGANETGLSLALMLEAVVKTPIGEGMKLEVQAESPDKSHVIVEVSAVSGKDAGVEALERKELGAGEKMTVRLGALGTR